MQFYLIDLVNRHVSVTLSVLMALIYLLALYNVTKAVMHVRTSQGAVAWSIALITFPYISLPLFWVFGRRRFHGYAALMRKTQASVQPRLIELQRLMEPYKSVDEQNVLSSIAEPLLKTYFTNGNQLTLLRDASAAYKAMLSAIAAAKKYILFQFFIVHDDGVGRQFQQALIEKAKQGLNIYFLYDELGCHQLPRDYFRELESAGVRVKKFQTTRGQGNRLQINFRNHRKIVVVDGTLAFTGGLNIGDEYAGKSKKFGYWRDTHLSIAGPAVQVMQLSILRDWYWAAEELLSLDWRPVFMPTNECALVAATGPERSLERGALLMLELINAAKHRLWIASPYFVPDGPIIHALQLAGLRGVDVRILLPNKPDHYMVYWCSFAFYADMCVANVKLYRYQPGFMHQKVILVDHEYAAVGSMNLDNRSLYLNFEMTVVSSSAAFISEVQSMLEKDFADSKQVPLETFANRPYLWQLGVKLIHLLAPIL